jgi:uncharacterized protein (TIGR03437 family)
MLAFRGNSGDRTRADFHHPDQYPHTAGSGHGNRSNAGRDQRGTSASFAAETQAESPSFFIFGAGTYLTATHGDGSLIGTTSLYPGLSTPARPGETIVLYANGFGPTSTPVVTGSETQSGSLNPPPVVTIGPNSAVHFAGLISPSLFQFIRVPISSLSNFGTLKTLGTTRL